MAKMHTIILFAVVFACWSANIECMKIDSGDKILPLNEVQDEEFKEDEEMNDPVQERLEGELRENQVQDFLQRDEEFNEDEEMNDPTQERLESELGENELQGFKEDEEMNDPSQERSESELRENQLQTFLQRDEGFMEDEEMNDPIQACTPKDPNIDCWHQCGTKGGRCPGFCGKEGYCCRKGYGDCPAVMKNAAHKRHHSCVRCATSKIQVQKACTPKDPNIDCWHQCGTKGGRCPGFCGKEGYCCRKGYDDCPAVMKNAAHKGHHSCVRCATSKIQVQKGCWTRKTRAAVHSAKLIKIYRSKTLEQCRRLCSENAACKQIEFYHHYGKKLLSYWKPNDCWLRGTGTPRKSSLNNDVYVLAPTCRKSCWARKTRAAVHSARLVKVFHSKTLDQCKHLCSLYSKCKQIEYYQNYGKKVLSYWKPNDCWLRSTGVPRRSSLNNDVYVFKC